MMMTAMTSLISKMGLHHLVSGYPDQHLPQRWIGRTAANDRALLRWPPRSPDLTPCDFFLWGTLRTRSVPPLPRDLPELRRRIVAAILRIDREILRRVWAEMDYRLDFCRVTKGGHRAFIYEVCKTNLENVSFCRYVACYHPLIASCRLPAPVRKTDMWTEPT
jgi:hypothetical protein